MYGSSYFDNDDNFPRYNFEDDHHHSKNSYSGPPLWNVIPFVVTFSFAVYVIIKLCCCKNSSATARPISGPPGRVNHTHTMDPSNGSTVVATAPFYEPTVHHHQTVCHDSPPSYAVAVGAASAAHCTSDSGAGFTSDSGAGCASDIGGDCSTDS